MPLLQWTSEFSVGSQKMDNEHKMLFSLINELNDKIKEGEGNVTLPYAFTQLKAYSIFHFSSEEEMMQKLNYPELASQKKAHGEFIKRINDFEDELNKMKMGTVDRVMTYLKAWWTSHILKEDKKYANYIK